MPNGLAAMLVTKRSAGVTPKVNMRHLVHASELSTLALKPKIRVSVAPQKGPCPPKISKKSS